MTRLWAGQPGNHGLAAGHKRFFSSPKHPDCSHGPQTCNGYWCCFPQDYSSARGMRLIMRTAVTANLLWEAVDLNRIIKENLQWRKLYTEIDLR